MYSVKEFLKQHVANVMWIKFGGLIKFIHKMFCLLLVLGTNSCINKHICYLILIVNQIQNSILLTWNIETKLIIKTKQYILNLSILLSKQVR